MSGQCFLRFYINYYYIMFILSHCCMLGRGGVDNFYFFFSVPRSVSHI